MDVFYFAPHQDDELTNLGVDLCREAENGNAVHAVLCTDGGASGVRKMLVNGGCCPWHPGAHAYPMDRAAFSAARDREFTESCLTLGVPPENIVISPLRGPDGGLTAETALRIMRAAIAGYPKEQVAVRTIAPAPGLRQNPDHTAVGLAAKALFAAGECAGLTLIREFILFPEDSASESALRPSAAALAKIKKAAAAYRRWAPAEGRYAVGYHSVADEFDLFLRDPFCAMEG